MDERLLIVCEEMDEDPSTEVMQIINEFLKDRPDYKLEKLREDFEFLKQLAESKI